MRLLLALRSSAIYAVVAGALFATVGFGFGLLFSTYPNIPENLGPLVTVVMEPVSYTHLTLPTIYSV